MARWLRTHTSLWRRTQVQFPLPVILPLNWHRIPLIFTATLHTHARACTHTEIYFKSLISAVLGEAQILKTSLNSSDAYNIPSNLRISVVLLDFTCAVFLNIRQEG